MNLLSLLPLIISASGLFLLVKLRFFFILHPKRCLKELRGAMKEKNAFKSLSLSLAGTLGVGNVVGVAFGISVGGAGSVFWLLLSSVFSLIIKFSEAALSCDAKVRDDRGMISVIEKSFTKKGKSLAKIYSTLCLFLSLSMGAALQSRAAVESISEKENSYVIGALIFAFLTAIAILGGGERIEKFTSFIIPIATFLYIALSFSVIVINIEKLPGVIKAIMKDALTPRAALGGGGAHLFISKMREGFSRGLLSNEAGAGTSSFAHSRNEATSPISVGLMGMCEVIFDTVILCMLTALAVLLAVPSPESYSSGIEIVKRAIGSLGELSAPTLSASIFAFAYSTVICWFYYGRCALSYLSQKGGAFFGFFFVFSVFAGALTPSSYLIVFSDYILLFLCLISLSSVIKSSDRLVFLSEQNGLITKGGYEKER